MVFTSIVVALCLFSTNIMADEVREYSGNANLKNVLHKHEEVMIKLIKDVKLLKDKVSALKQANKTLQEKLDKYKNIPEEVNIDTVPSKYDAEFKAYIKESKEQ